MAANYLPLLLAANAATPDDSSVTTLPTGQVDYLSHEWREEDVWSSWRNMTRQKNAIANGTRLENASWRTWWKQRNGLKTISPETLNWLKDSDVTWLYGPLHPGVDWYPLTKDSSGDLDGNRSLTPSATSPPTKPILKHRSIGDLLSLPPAPLFDGDDESDEAPQGQEEFIEPAKNPHGHRPLLLHTKSDTHLVRRNLPQLLRKDSPPRIFAGTASAPVGTPDETGSSSGSTGSEQDLVPGSAQPGKKKHISFNTFVEQCIAIEKPKPKRQISGVKPRFAVVPFDDDGYDEDSETGYGDSEDGLPAPFFPSYGDSDSDSDDPLEMQTSSSRSRSSSSSRSIPNHSYHQPARRPSSDSHVSPSEKEHRTIAYIAPTILKTTGVGNNVPAYGYDPGLPVELVYVPPMKGNQSATRYGSGTSSGGSAELYTRHDDGYFVAHGSGISSPAGTSPRIPSVGFADQQPKPVVSPTSVKPSLPPARSEWTDEFSESIIHSEPIGILLDGEPEVVVQKDAFDYIVGPDLGEDFSEKRPHNRRKASIEDQRAAEVKKYALGGADSNIAARINVPDARSVTKSVPLVVAKPRTEQISPSKPLYVPSAVPRTASFDHSPNSSSLLCPPDAPTRGRSSPTSGPSVNGSTTSPSTSQTRSSDSRSESRGRSSTRNSSYSDRERSGSRSSKGTNSPLGSISPSNSVIGLGGQHGTRDRVGVVGGGSRERGRERTGRKLSGSVSSSPSSLSPPNPASPTRGSSGDYEPYHPTQSELYSSLSGSMADSLSSTGSNASTIGPNSTSSESTVTGDTADKPHPTPEYSSISRNYRNIRIPIPSPIPEEEEQRSRHPTPANSPIMSMRPALPIAPPHMSSPSICTTPPSPPKPANITLAHRELVEESVDDQQVGTLVGRAVEIVSSARGIIGSFWHS